MQESVRQMHHDIGTPKSYRDRAADCQRLADAATDGETRDTMTYLAELWRAMADQDVAEVNPRMVPAPSLPASE
jgi:hypothetical protein